MTRAAVAALVLGWIVLAACGGGSAAEDLGENVQALETFPNEQPAFDYFLAKGLTPAQSAGIVGNLDQESGLDPTIAQKGGPGRGIAQWSVGGRWDTTKGDNVQAYAAQQGKSATSLGLQLDFIWFELASFPDYGLAKLQATTTTSDAVLAFAKYYEGCGTCENATRTKYADSVLARFGGDAPDGSASSSSSGGEAGAETCTVQATGKSGTCITTSACAALGDHESTPGACPGAADIQCCTSTADGSGASGARSSDTSDGGCEAADHGPASGSWLLALGAMIALRGSARRRSAACARR